MQGNKKWVPMSRLWDMGFRVPQTLAENRFSNPAVPLRHGHPLHFCDCPGRYPLCFHQLQNNNSKNLSF
jgi:hypothetical protein